jgi:hypothetical protein
MLGNFIAFTVAKLADFPKDTRLKVTVPVSSYSDVFRQFAVNLCQFSANIHQFAANFRLFAANKKLSFSSL